MSGLTAEQLVQRAMDYDLLDDRGLRVIWSDVGGRDVDLDEMKSILLRRDLLTPYQLDHLVKGDRHGYYYGKYKVLYPIGQGTFARVYRAVEKETGTVVAVKVLRNRFAGDSEKITQFHKEGELGTRLRHPNIVSIFDVVRSTASTLCRWSSSKVAICASSCGFAGRWRYPIASAWRWISLAVWTTPRRRAWPIAI
ncbi:MAG: protein kinase [Pirellulales bacterium]